VSLPAHSDADAVELRVLGCLIEKQRTTPEVYPLSLNSLRLACNQSTNRDPVVDYDESTIRAALDRLSRKGWTRLASGPGSRAAKFRHLFDEALRLSDEEVALLCVLMLRGAQTPGELKHRTQRLHPFASLDELDAVLEGLISRELARRLPRRPGQKEVRYEQLLGGGDPAFASSSSSPAGDDEEGVRVCFADDDEGAEMDRLAEVERALRELRAEVAELRAELASARSHEGP
jgi:uncharacterized protein YceH (UPF0502 family)